jgi:hypothetical protein
VPSKNVTVPVGIVLPLVPLTTAVSVTICPDTIVEADVVNAVDDGCGTGGVTTDC